MISFAMLTGLAIVGVQTAPAPAPIDQEAERILLAAFDATLAISGAAYDARVETSIGGVTRRVETGSIQFLRLTYSDDVGAKLRVRGERTSDSSGQSEPSNFSYDGQSARRLLADSNVMLQGDLHYGGRGVLTGNGHKLVIAELMSDEPYAKQRAASGISLIPEQMIDDTRCVGVEVVMADPPSTERWYFAADDHLPRLRIRTFRSARGREVVETTTISNMTMRTYEDDSLFQLALPEGYKAEMMGTAPPPPLRIGDDAPEWELVDDRGNLRTLSEFRGQVVVLDFWATWCKYCRAAMPAVQHLHDTYADRGVAVLAVNCRDAKDVDAVGFVREKSFTYPVLTDGSGTAGRYQVRGIPAFVVIDPQGKLTYMRSGYGPERERRLIEAIERQLAGG